jgi:acyl-CoA reductase-like NAD-dependent aldehyde dehydrogenase
MNATLDLLRGLRADLSRDQRLLIDGQWRPASTGRLFDTYDPATGAVIAKVAEAGEEDIGMAVAAARRSVRSRSWTGLSADARARVLWRFADLLESHSTELAHLEVLNNGMPMAFANWMVSASAIWLRYYAGSISRIHGKTAGTAMNEPGRAMHAYTAREPLGVVGLIIPWNGPIGTLIMKVAPALAAGCACIVKPAENTPLTALRVGALALEAGVPPGVLNILPGLGPVAGAALASHPDVDKVSFTGSTEVGKQIVRSAAGNLKRVTLELGGKSPCIICDDADLDAAIPAAAMAILANSGQVCFAGSRLYAGAKVFDRVVAGIADYASKLKLGSGFEPTTAMGPLISRKQQDRVLAYVDTGRKEGAAVAFQGSVPSSDGYFVAPTIFVNTDVNARIVKDEIFGPVLVATRMDDLDEIIEVANDTRYGLGAGVFTRDLSNAHRLAQALQSGNVWVNCYGLVHPTMPFGGYKESGWGREMSSEGLDAFLETKSVFMQL